LVAVDGGVRVVGRNANGRGSVYFDAANKAWKATWYDAAGKRRTVTAATRAGAEERRDAKLADHRQVWSVSGRGVRRRRSPSRLSRGWRGP
jgi:hypothetical protein